MRHFIRRYLQRRRVWANLPPHVRHASRARRRGWRWPWEPVPPELAGPFRSGAVALLPVVSPHVIPELREFIARHYPARRAIVVLGNLLIPVAILFFCAVVGFDGLNGGVWGVFRAGVFGILPFVLPLFLIVRGFLLGKRRPGDDGIPTVAMVRNQIIRPDAATMLIDLRLAGCRFRELVAIVQDPFLVWSRYHRYLIQWGIPWCVAWYLTLLAGSDFDSLMLKLQFDLPLFLILFASGRSVVIAVVAMGAAENLREMVAWLAWSSADGARDTVRRLKLLTMRAIVMTVLPLVAATTYLIAQAVMLQQAAWTLHLPLAVLGLLVLLFHRRINRTIYYNVLRDLRRVLVEGEAVLPDAIARLAEKSR